MSGPDLEKFAQKNVTFAIAKCQVEFIHIVADRLRAMRTAKDLSQVAMARLMGVSQARIAQIESGRPGDAPSLEQVAAYAYLCDQPIELSFGGWTKPKEGSKVAHDTSRAGRREEVHNSNLDPLNHEEIKPKQKRFASTGG